MCAAARWEWHHALLTVTFRVARIQQDNLVDDMAHTRSSCLALDRADPLSAARARFVLPEGVNYLDGNSLGALPKGVAERVARTIEHEWGVGLIRSWNAAGWYESPGRIGAKLAPLLGAAPHQVTVTDTISVNLFKLLVAVARLRPAR